MRLKSGLNIAVAAGFVISSAASAGVVTGGEFVLDFDEAALSGLTSQLNNNAWWDAAASADKGEADMRTLPAPGAVPDSFTFAVFGSSVPTPPAGLPGRFPKASTFDYTGDPTTGTGVIGLAGAHVADGSFNGELIFGDYDLRYDASRVGNAAGGSGWFLTNNISFSSESWDLTNVATTIIDGNNFSLSGDVALTAATGGFLGGAAGTDIGDFSFTATVVPIPAAAWLLGTGLVSLVGVSRRKNAAIA